MNKKIIPFELVIEAEQFMSQEGEANNSFKRILDKADEFLELGSTPAFVLDTNSWEIEVLDADSLGQKIH
jgi:hypothetical protein